MQWFVFGDIQYNELCYLLCISYLAVDLYKLLAKKNELGFLIRRNMFFPMGTGFISAFYKFIPQQFILKDLNK